MTTISQPTTSEKVPNIPQWEWADLLALSQRGQLSGVDPTILGAIDQAESSGQGGAINSEGYGGFFGLGSNVHYPAGTSTPSLLSDPGQASFDTQSQIAASEFAYLLGQTGGNPYAAETMYQGGSQEGVGIFQQLGIPGTPLSGYSAATSTGTLPPGSTSPSGPGGNYVAAKTAFGKVLQEIDGFYNPTVTVVPSWTNIFGGGIINGVAGTILTGVDRAIGILFGVGLVYIGIRMMSEHGSSTGTLRTAVRVGGDVMVGREAAASRQAVQASRATVSARQIVQRAAQAAQRARESAARVAAQERATAVRAQAEARRSAEDENARRRRSDRPRERGVA